MSLKTIGLHPTYINLLQGACTPYLSKWCEDLHSRGEANWDINASTWAYTICVHPVRILGTLARNNGTNYRLYVCEADIPMVILMGVLTVETVGSLRECTPKGHIACAVAGRP